MEKEELATLVYLDVDLVLLIHIFPFLNSHHFLFVEVVHR
jgi:hypothetical protein